jgi:hypothetical protein
LEEHLKVVPAYSAHFWIKEKQDVVLQQQLKELPPGTFAMLWDFEVMGGDKK